MNEISSTKLNFCIIIFLNVRLFLGRYTTFVSFNLHTDCIIHNSVHHFLFLFIVRFPKYFLFNINKVVLRIFQASLYLYEFRQKYDNVTCRVVHVTNKTGSSSVDWIY
jgi:hypothetical protein